MLLKCKVCICYLHVIRALFKGMNGWKAELNIVGEAYFLSGELGNPSSVLWHTTGPARSVLKLELPNPGEEILGNSREWSLRREGPQQDVRIGGTLAGCKNIVSTLQISHFLLEISWLPSLEQASVLSPKTPHSQGQSSISITSATASLWLLMPALLCISSAFSNWHKLNIKTFHFKS